MIEPPIFDVSGVHGASGTSGEDLGQSTAPLSQHGLRGGRATIGQRGTPAGTISVQLATPTTTANIPENVVLANPIDADVKLDASFVCTTGRLQKMDTVLKINSGESMCLLASGGNGGHGGHGGHGQNGGKGFKYGAFLELSFKESISEDTCKTGDRMQLNTDMVLMAVLVAMEEMAVTQVKAVMVDLEEPFESLFPKTTLISSCSVVPSIILAEEGVQQGNQESEVSLFRVILLRPLSKINFSIRQWRKGRGRWLVIHVFNKARR